MVGGFHNPEHMERFLAEGACDLISMGRSWICDPEYGKKIFSGNTEDIIPCVRCNKCHVQNETGPWLNVCSVNPIHGLRARMSHMVDPSGLKKRVAVVGGGPAGMMAALTAVKQGHTVDLYEKKNHLGGQLCHAEALRYANCAPEFKLLGDCNIPANMQAAIRSGFAAASLI